MACPHCGREHPGEGSVCPILGPFAGTRPTSALSVGEILDGKYEIARELGRGAMGVVYEALHLGLGRRVAIKTLLGPSGADGEASARFEREAQSASAIGHPNIIDIFDLGCTRPAFTTWSWSCWRENHSTPSCAARPNCRFRFPSTSSRRC